MATRDERRALGFLAVVALLGAAVRTVGVQRFEAETFGLVPPTRRAARAAGHEAGRDAALADRALAAQIAAIDSVRAAPRRSRSGKARKPSGASSRPPGKPTLRRGAGPSEPLDINAASTGDLERLPRIGPALARRIVAWRDEHGPFASLDELRRVRGIGPSTLRLLEPLVTFSGGHRPLLREGTAPSLSPLCTVH
ncbi:MAG: ComEA family DNA-binding protein [Gemmatimonas sp.]|jgi:competence ComEA-like helix-hairpin-helix protein|uniref:ComEA family DNA-binding protein n=1 Tax=Gemmatimonas sp. TaxID=1962908 RepID=UPI00391F2ED2|nr:helix-hairpin-helix domain-containing protein [Gemmatimonadota bacterium]